MHIEDKDIDTSYNMEKVMNSFKEMKDQLVYSGLSIPLRTHEFGAADIIPKQ